MCVIAIVDKTRPTADQIKLMWDQNPQGGGVAYRDTIKEGNKVVKVVKWEKGLSKDEMVEAAANLPLPYIAHFRIPTCGGSRPALCHPFPIAPDVPLDLQGTTKGFVLFHNGHWGSWKNTVQEASIRNNFKLPSGKWSDSRAMAWMAAHFDLGMLEIIDEKCVAFSPTDLEICGGPWCQVSEGLWTSNKSWERSTTYYHGGNTTLLCLYGQCKKHKYSTTNYCFDHQDKDPAYKPAIKVDDATDAKVGGTSPNATFRPGDAAVQGGKDEQKEVQEGSSDVRPGTSGDAQRPLTPNTDSATVNDQHGLTRWSRSIEPRTFRNAADVTRESRRKDADRGIEHVGPM